MTVRIQVQRQTMRMAHAPAHDTTTPLSTSPVSNQIVAHALPDRLVVQPSCTPGDNIDGQSTITLDPRNVAVHYTDREGNCFEIQVRSFISVSRTIGWSHATAPSPRPESKHSELGIAQNRLA